jgi:hypothetical protein
MSSRTIWLSRCTDRVVAPWVVAGTPLTGFRGHRGRHPSQLRPRVEFGRFLSQRRVRPVFLFDVRCQHLHDAHG